MSLNTLHVLGLGDFERAVACLNFSKADGGSFLAAIDEANEHVISVWEWNKGDKGHKITETKSSTDPVLVVEFHPLDKNTLVTCGKNHLAFWNLEGCTLTKKMGIFEVFVRYLFYFTLYILTFSYRVATVMESHGKHCGYGESWKSHRK